MASPINNIPESIIEETLIQLEGNSEVVNNLNPGNSRLLEPNTYQLPTRTNIYLKRIDAEAKSTRHTDLNPLHNRAVAQRTRTNTQRVEQFILENPQYSINIHEVLANILHNHQIFNPFYKCNLRLSLIKEPIQIRDIDYPSSQITEADTENSTLTNNQEQSSSSSIGRPRFSSTPQEITSIQEINIIKNPQAEIAKFTIYRDPSADSDFLEDIVNDSYPSKQEQVNTHTEHSDSLSSETPTSDSASSEYSLLPNHTHRKTQLPSNPGAHEYTQYMFDNPNDSNPINPKRKLSLIQWMILIWETYSNPHGMTIWNIGIMHPHVVLKRIY